LKQQMKTMRTVSTKID